MDEKAVIEIRGIAAQLSERMRCNCDFDKWEPTRSSGHTVACPIHNAAMEQFCNQGFQEKVGQDSQIADTKHSEAQLSRA